MSSAFHQRPGASPDAQGRLAVSYEPCTAPGCPNPGSAPELLRTAPRSEDRSLIRDSGLVTACVITAGPGFAALRCHGYPAFTACGQDLVPSTAGSRISYRAYSINAGLTGLPSVASLAAVRGLAAGV